MIEARATEVGADHGTGVRSERPSPVPQIDGPVTSEQPLARAEPRDAPYCYQCGNAMQRAGSCYVCASCGTTSGCS